VSIAPLVVLATSKNLSDSARKKSIQSAKFDPAVDQVPTTISKPWKVVSGPV
jgi:hypothetical protein